MNMKQQLAGVFSLAFSFTSAMVLAGLSIPLNNPEAVVDLMTVDGAAAVSAVWRYHDAAIVEVDHRSPGFDLKSSGPPNRTHDINPHAGVRDFNDIDWEIIDPATLTARRATGRLSFGWYRTKIILPDRVGRFDLRGSTVVLEVVVDDYAEIWVDGKLPQVLGQVGGNLAAGWNAPNRVVLARNAEPGRQIQVAIFAANGPFSDPPGNFIWMRSATLDFYRPEAFTRAQVAPVEVVRLDLDIDALIPGDAKLEKLAEGFTFTEGPVWVPAKWGGAGYQPVEEGYLLFSDPNRNMIYRLTADGDVSVFRTKSGYAGLDLGEYRQPGSNGLALDPQGRLTICEHGNRRVTRLEPSGVITVLADRIDGKRLNSPNDLAYRSDGALYFTDPPFGLPKFHDDPRREAPHTGVYFVKDGKVSLVSTDLTGPNGVAFSPDQKHLYVANWDVHKKIVMRYEAQPDGSLKDGTVFFDMTAAPGEEALDGVEVDAKGNLYVSGPGGVWVISGDGKHLGMIKAPELPANFAWGDDDGRTLYMAARTGLYRMRMSVGAPGAFKP
jgi:gluconolactonase